MITLMFKKSEIVALCKVDAEIIHLALSKNKELGRAAIKDAIANFQNFLFSRKGTMVFNMDMDYRTYIVNLLESTIKNADEESRNVILKEIVVPS